MNPMEHADVVSKLLNMQMEAETAQEGAETANSTTVQATMHVPSEQYKENTETMRPVDNTNVAERQQQAAERYELLRQEQNENEWNEIFSDDKHGDNDLFLKSSLFCRLSPAAATQLVKTETVTTCMQVMRQEMPEASPSEVKKLYSLLKAVVRSMSDSADYEEFVGKPAASANAPLFPM